MTPILFTHLISIGIWAGCVAVEIVCELDQKNLNFKKSYIASLHWKIDKYVEIPAIMLTLITGLLLLENAPNDPLLLIKIIAGIAAVVLNSIASFTVYKRYKCFTLEDEAGYYRYNLLHERVGVGCVLTIAIAIVVGGYYLTR